MSRSRRWAWTTFEPACPEFLPPLSYMVCGLETCPTTQREHWQGYLELETKLRLTSLKLLPGFAAAHLEIAQGTLEENQDYCLKTCGENYLEFGEPMLQGQRTDLTAFASAITAGDTTVDEILLAHPHTYHVYGRTLLALEDLRSQSLVRTGKPTVYWFWGPTGTGKTRTALEDSNPETRWIWTDDHGWWDGYQGQSDVVLDDFRGQVPFATLLRILDRYEVRVPRRNRQPVPFLATRIWLTSPHHPRESYQSERVLEDIEQLVRRIDHIVHFNVPL